MLKKFALLLCATVLFVSSTESVSALDLQSWGKKVMKKVAKAQKYPPSAVSREIEGRAEVSVVVAADGTITSSEIKKKTGHQILDRQIPKIIKRISPLPALPGGRESMTFKIPLVWKLN